MNVRDARDVLEAFGAYRACALWSEEFEGEALSADAYRMLDSKLRNFLLKVHYSGIDISDLDPEDIGHDLWLTQNHHGAGFWDGDYPEAVGDKLTSIANTMGELSLWRAEDGVLEVE